MQKPTVSSNASQEAIADRPSVIDFESFHISSRPASRRASPAPLTNISPSVIDSDKSPISSGRSDQAESNYGSNKTPQSKSQHSALGSHSIPGASLDVLDSPYEAHANYSRPVVVQIPPSQASGLSEEAPYVRRAKLPGAPVPDDSNVSLANSARAFPPTPLVATPGLSDPWANCVKVLRDYDEHMVKGWKEDVDSLLVFAGLFSAVLTAFNIESYKLLQEDPDETTANLLRQISAQLATSTVSVANSTASLNSEPFRADSRSVRINILWFSSLVLSLVSASIGILTKQWLREYISNAASSPRENARIRQLRHEGFVHWHIPLTIALLPILLQVAMALFFAGLLDLLWSLHHAVAGVITVLVSISLSFLVITTIMPTVRGDCPYKSPQAMGVFLLTQALTRFVSWFALKVYTWMGWNRRQWPLYVDTGLFSRRRRLFAGWLRSLIHHKYFGSWREREKAIVRASEAKLDHHILASADATFMDDYFLERVLRQCIDDTENQAAVDCLYEIVAHRADDIVDGIPHWKHSDDVDGGINVLLHLTMDMLPRIDYGNEECILRTLTVAERLCRAIPFECGHLDTVVLYQRLFENLARLLSHNERVRRTSFDLMRNTWYRSSAPVSPSVIQSLTSFARTAKIASELTTFHHACEMALAFSTASNLPRVVFNTVRNELQDILEDLENYLTLPDSGVGAITSGQSASILLALEELYALDPDLISANLLRIIDHINVDPRQLAGSTGSMESFLQRRLASARALRKMRESKLREGRPRWKEPRRRNAMDVQLPAVADAPDLHLPETPQKNASVVPSPVADTPSPIHTVLSGLPAHSSS
ncbi:hypothetical protein L226DRAFT_572628 [Lentinus tigrinus ALCF2SS1-7]|uniref:DUF6535 domain-containing protein n=1 Tax=Lentinus tigrinus ALCF2SS1-6 TaxID=1328759 RepID=A0A5C2RMU9_9APHY|nr:hypothetical protein L227DRAFT_617365 [Lentinus tigrinus ALCF2SS1-6]RPD73194.1 hypothetical protein L226DRAFT_572628 [Lentinus tigrinus ALCF2SS1-7]